MQGKNRKVESFLMNIDEFSHKLGSLETKQATMESTMSSGFAVINDKLDKLMENNNSLKGSVGTAHTRIDSMEEEIDEAVTNGRDWMKTKTIAKWLVGGTVITGGAGGAGLGNWLSKFLG